MFEKDNTGFKIVEGLVVVGLILALVAVGLALLNNERAQVRDAHRLADMILIASAFDVMHNETNSYADAARGCSEVRQLVSQCELTTYLGPVQGIVDPGGHEYIVTKVPTAKSYEITFTLERAYGSLSAGNHTLSELGIR
jgi:hypothetical protein